MNRHTEPDNLLAYYTDHRYSDLMDKMRSLPPELLKAYGQAQQLERRYERAFKLLPESRSFSDETNSITVILATPARVSQILLDQDWRNFLSADELGGVITQTITQGFVDMYMATAQSLEEQDPVSDEVDIEKIEEEFSRKTDELMAAAQFKLPPRDNEVFFSAVEDTLRRADTLLDAISGSADTRDEFTVDEHRHLIVRGYGTLHPEFILEPNWVANAPTALIAAKLDTLLQIAQRGTTTDSLPVNQRTNNEELGLQAIAALNQLKEQF